MKTYCMPVTHLECSSLGHGIKRLGTRTNMKLMIPAVPGVIKSTGSDSGISGILSAFMKLWQPNLQACKKGEITDSS